MSILAVAKRRGEHLNARTVNLSLEDEGDNDPWDIPSAICWGKYEGHQWILCRVSFAANDAERPLFSAKAEVAFVALVDEDRFWASDFRLHSVFQNAKQEVRVGVERMLKLMKTDAVEYNGVKIELAWERPASSQASA
jgi:hypothetical protein